MKLNNTLLWVLAIFCLPLAAQENKTVKEETTVTKIIKKEGGKVIVTEVTNIEKEKGTLIIEGNDKVDQQYFESNEVADENKVTTEQISIDQENKAAIEAAQKEQEAELKASIEAEKARAAEEKKMLDEKTLAQQKELEENRKRLESRPKGMSKLKTKKDN